MSTNHSTKPRATCLICACLLVCVACDDQPARSGFMPEAGSPSGGAPYTADAFIGGVGEEGLDSGLSGAQAGSAHDMGNAPGLWLDSRAMAHSSLTNPPDHIGCETFDWLGNPSLLIATLDNGEGDHGEIVSASGDVCMPTDLTITDCQATTPSSQIIQQIKEWAASIGG